MIWITANFPHLAKSCADKLTAICTTRENGVSRTPFGSLNLAMHVGDSTIDIRTNRAILRDALFNTYQLKQEPYWLEQTHSNKVLRLPQQYFHECATNKVPEADASFTQQAKIPCVVMTADCLPLLIVNQDATEVAAIHAGWKGLANGVIEQTINAMASDNNQLHVWLGPAIGAEAFEVGDDVRQLFLNQSSEYQLSFKKTKVESQSKQQKYLANIYAIAKVQLNQLGVKYISGGDYCTYSQSDLFFSYRREGQTGRMASLICIKN